MNLANSLAVKRSSDQGGNHVVSRAQECTSHKSEDDDIGVHGSETPEDQPGDVLEKLGSSQMRGIEKPEERAGQKPERRT